MTETLPTSQNRSSSANLTPHFRLVALSLYVAYRALVTNETPVACVFYSESTQTVLSYGCNDTNRSLNGTRHAEFLGVDKILKKFIPRAKWGDSGFVRQFFHDVTLYVSVEPCVMCALALKQLGIGKVVYGCGNDRFGGNGTVILVHNDDRENTYDNYASYGGILRTEAIQLLRNFYIQENDLAPVPKVKKNKDLENKQYPPMLSFDRYLKYEEFEDFYGPARLALFHSNDLQEVTPLLNRGYSLEDLIDIKSIGTIPELEQLFPGQEVTEELLRNDLAIFFRLFYPVTAEGRIDFSNRIVTLEELHEENRIRKRNYDSVAGGD